MCLTAPWGQSGRWGRSGQQVRYRPWGQSALSAQERSNPPPQGQSGLSDLLGQSGRGQSNLPLPDLLAPWGRSVPSGLERWNLRLPGRSGLWGREPSSPRPPAPSGQSVPVRSNLPPLAP